MNIGAYPIEQDYSYYVANATDTVLAVVGTATKGPINEPTLCTSTQDFVNKFGPLKVGYYGLYAGQYFLSQSSKLYFIRAAADTATGASAVVGGTGVDDTEIDSAITIRFLEKGTYHNGDTLTITQGVPVESEDGAIPTYTLTVTSKSGVVIDKVENITLEDLMKGTKDKPEFKTSMIEVATFNNATTKLTLTPDGIKFVNGNDGVPENLATTSDKDEYSAPYITAATKLTNASPEINLISVPGVSSAAVIVDVLSIAESRGNCMYLVDPPAGLDVAGVIDWHNGTGEYEHDNVFDSSYGALYYDWVHIYDSTNKQEVLVPPSVVVAPTYAHSDRTSEVWYAPAGLRRGMIRGVLSTASKPSMAEIEAMYSGSNNINALYEDPQYGLVIWGQKTLQRTDTALNRINVRRMLNYLKKVVTVACNYLTFEPNDRVTWNSFRMLVEPVLSELVTKRGIYEYRIIKGDTIVTAEDIDNYRMPCMIAIKPMKTAEEIPIYFALTSTGADFNEVLEANGISIQ